MGHFQDSQGITEKTTYFYFHRGPQNWNLDNQFFVKEVHGNIWRTATIDQPAAEPDSYWGQVSRQLHLEKDQINDQTKVFTFSF